MKSYEELYEIAKTCLSEYRFHHSECVAKRCMELAKKYGYGEDSSYINGVLGSLSKEIAKKDKENQILDKI